MDTYYDDGKFKIYNGDCREILPDILSEIDPESNLVLTDPPYGIFEGKKIGKNFYKKETIIQIDSTISNWDKRPEKEILTKLKSMCKYYIIWGGNYFSDILGNCCGPLIWDKENGKNIYADCELAWNNVSKSARIYRHQWFGSLKSTERGIRSQHPTQKPVSLMIWCINFVKDPVDIIDPYMGSGTSLRAAKDLGRKAIGIELKEKYCEIAVKRLSQEVLFG